MEYEPLPERRPEVRSATGRPPERRPRRAPRSGGFWRHLWRWAWAYALGLGAASGVFAAAVIHMPQVEELEGFTPDLITELYDARGEPLQIYAVEHRMLLREGEVPELLQKAILAVEDDRFFQHGGIDLNGVFRAAAENLRAGEITQGASTLTMQVAENLFHTRGRDWKRKIAEALLAVEIEKRYSKQQILTLYTNLIYMSDGNYGMEAAAQAYFNKPVAELGLAEAATLAGIPQRPSAYNPFRNPELVTRRRNHVLGRMRQVGSITAEQYQQAMNEPLLVVKRRPEKAPLGAYFSEEVRRYLEARYGAKTLYGAGLQVRTTLDPAVQRAVETAVRDQLLALDHRRGWRGPNLHLDDELESRDLPSWRGSELTPGTWYEGIVLRSSADTAEVRIHDQRFTLERDGIAWTRKQRLSDALRRGDVAWFRLEAGEDGGRRLLLEQEPLMESAAVVLESATGAIRGMVGGWDFERSKFNRVTQAQRQVGSAFKPFVYGAALELGFTPADTIFDAPVSFMGADARLSYVPRNYSGNHLGILTLRRALEKSINVPAVKLLDLVGVERVIDFARRCGIHSELPPYPSLALGSADLVPIELAAGYATFVNQGLHVEPYLVESVATADGRLLEEHVPQAQKAMDAEIAYVLTHMLEGVVDRGTGASLARLPLDLAGKTGTTNDFSDAWFVGFTPRYTILSWVGYDVKKPLGHGMTGAAAALPIWKGIAERGLEEGWIAEGESFTVPPGVTLMAVEHSTGLLPPAGAEGSVRTVREAFVSGTEPTRDYEFVWARALTLPWYQQRAFYIPKEGERMPGGRGGGDPATPAGETR